MTSTTSGSPMGDQLVNTLEARIVDGTWGPGTKLPSERTLAEESGVSRTLVREALKTLQERGFVTAEVGRGSFVRVIRPTAEGVDPLVLARRGQVTAHHLITARVMLEGKAAALAAENRTRDDITTMRRVLDGFAESTEIAESAQLDVAFHEAVAIASSNPVIQLMFGSIRELTHGVVLRSLTDRALRGAATPLHETVFGAIVARDPIAAQTAMTDHIGAAQRFYAEDLNLPLRDVLLQRAQRAPDLANVLYQLGHSIADLETENPR